MLAPRHVLFTAVEGTLIDSASDSWNAAGEALEALEHRRIPLVLSTRGTRAEMELLRRKIQHGHPFFVETGAALFIPDGYFNSFRLEGAVRVGRYFCVPFARPQADAAEAAQQIAAEAGASVVCLSQMSTREIAGNTGASPRDAEVYRQREFSELFFFAGEAEQSARRFSEIARRMHWEAVPGAPFWELRSAASNSPAAAHLMGLYRRSLHTKPRFIGIACDSRDVHLLSAMDRTVVLPPSAGERDDGPLSRLPRAVRGLQPGPEGWSLAVADILETYSAPKR